MDSYTALVVIVAGICVVAYVIIKTKEYRREASWNIFAEFPMEEILAYVAYVLTIILLFRGCTVQ